MLEIIDLNVRYGAIHAVRSLSLDAKPGVTIAILGANGAGKSSLLRAVSGLVGASGDIRLDGDSIASLSAEERSRRGISQVMEGRRLFRDLSVETNLRLAWQYGRRTSPIGRALSLVYEEFPILETRRQVQAGWLSGGQQQMMILSAALMRDPRYLLLDEPSLGLAPIVVRAIYKKLEVFARESKAAILVAEQMARVALAVSERYVVLKRGEQCLEGISSDLLTDGNYDSIVQAYL